MQYTKTIKAVLYWLVIVYLVSSITAVRAGSLFRPRTPGKNNGPLASLSEASNRILYFSGLIRRSLAASGRSGNALKRSEDEQNPKQPETASADPCPRPELVSPDVNERALCPYEFVDNTNNDRKPATIMYAKAANEEHFCLDLNGKLNHDSECVLVYYNQPVQIRDENNWKNCTEQIPVARVCVRPKTAK